MDVNSLEKGVTDNPDANQGNSSLLHHQSAQHMTGSVVSLTPEAEMSIILGKEAINKENNLKLIDFHCLTKSEPNLIYKPSGKHNAPCLDKPQKFKAIMRQPVNGNVAHQIGSSQNYQEQTTSLLPSEGDMPNGNSMLYQRSISCNPKFPSAFEIVNDGKERQISLTEFPHKDNEFEMNSESIFHPKKEDICNCADWCCKLSCCGPCTNSGLHKLLR